jgi:uncharacterized protein (TIGR02391 family)
LDESQGGGRMINKPINEQQLKALCDVLGHTSSGFSKTELTQLLRECDIAIADDGSSKNGYTYTLGLNKAKWLFNCFAEEINKRQGFDRIYLFIEKALNPVSYTHDSHRDNYAYRFEETNKVLLFIGLEISKSGKISEAPKAESLDEVDRRVNSLKRHLYNRAIHQQVEKYCVKDYLRRDYFDAVFEAAKGLADRVRDISGLSLDGGKLFQTAFAKNDPYIFFNAMKTESEISEFTGLKELLEAIFHLIRNPAAHTPKINWRIDETKALDVLTVISFAHKYLDECLKMPRP